ncbi:MAG: TolC family protein [Brumimicrobium sp.]
MNRLIYILFSFLFLQTAEVRSQDSLQKMGFDDFMTIVKKNHPLAKKADLRNAFGEAELLKSKGGFDPKAYSNIGQKYFNDNQYYSLIDAGLKVPTWYGIELYSGFEQGNGNFVNPERSTPENGLVYGGISVSVGQGLFIDERRAQLKKAKIYTKITEEERRILINELLLNASKTYWKWYATAQKVNVYDEAVELAEIRLEGVRESALVGDVPDIDTLEALIQLQNRQVSYQQAELDYKNMTEALSVYIWDENEVPLEISDKVTPPSQEEVLNKISTISQVEHVDSLIQYHPRLQKAQLDIDQLEIQKRWDAEKLKPTLDLKYNALNQPVNGNVFEGYSVNNYRWGLTFAMPLFLRKSRGELNRTKLMIQDQKLGLDNLEAQVKFGVNAAVNTWRTTQSQLEIYSQTVNNVRKLLEGEQQKFMNGESSLFLVNSREVRFINAQIDYFEALAKNQHALIEIQYSLGILD